MRIRALFTWSPYQIQRRAIVKTIGYRLFMILITIGVAYFITNSASDAINIGIITNLMKTGTYYVYERFWDRITWGLDTNRA